MPTAIITGASRGLGRALADDLGRAGWRVVADARTAADLEAAAGNWPNAVALAGDVTDPGHRHALVDAAGDRIDLLVLNASSLGPSPLPPLAGYDLEALRAVLETNTVAPLALTQLALPAVRAAGGRILAVSSDAAVEGYPGWGGYGSSKAATAVIGAPAGDRMRSSDRSAGPRRRAGAAPARPSPAPAGR